MDTVFILKSTFSVLDHHVIQNLIVDRQKENMLLLMFKIPYFKDILKVYFIQVRKISQIMIDFMPFESHNYLVYDCPNFVARYKRNFVKRMRSSTFQCIVQVLMKYIPESNKNVTLAYKAVSTQGERV